ncbi:mCG141710 [Mus musculus]|nr:mCG141710 [Mus musculus]
MTETDWKWRSASIRICIGQALAEPLRGQPYQAPANKNFLASAIVSGFGVCMWDGSPGLKHPHFGLPSS